jgi:hypothetical protein
VEGEYFNVYFKNIEKIGIVSPELAKDISAFYTFASSVVEDLNWMAVAKIEEVTKEKALKEMYPMRETLKETVSIGNKIIKQIETTL